MLILVHAGARHGAFDETLAGMLRKGKEHLSVRFDGSVNRDVQLYLGSGTRKKLRDRCLGADNRSLMATVATSNPKAPELKPGRTQAHRGDLSRRSSGDGDSRRSEYPEARRDVPKSARLQWRLVSRELEHSCAVTRDDDGATARKPMIVLPRTSRGRRLTGFHSARTQRREDLPWAARMRYM